MILPKTGVNDPEGDFIGDGLRDLGFQGLTSVRAGRFFRLRIMAEDPNAAFRRADEMCQRLLANPVIETYEIEIAPVLDAATATSLTSRASLASPGSGGNGQ